MGDKWRLKITALGYVFTSGSYLYLTLSISSTGSQAYSPRSVTWWHRPNFGSVVGLFLIASAEGSFSCCLIKFHIRLPFSLKAQIMEQVMTCPYCGGSVSFVSSAVVYNGKDFGMIYLCGNYPICDAYVGVHKGTTRPLGTLANAELREWRVKAHKVFNQLWESQKMNNDEAYKLMQGLMNMNRKEAHIGKFDVEQCKMLIRKLEEYNQSKGGAAEICPNI